MSKKKTVFFDAAGTLFYVSHGVGFHYRRIAEKYGVRVDPLYIDQRFHSAYGKASPMALSGKQAEKLWWRDLVRVVFEEVSFPQFDPFFDEVYSSTAKRALETAERVGKRAGFSLDDVVATPEILEMDMGKWEGRPRVEVYTPEMIDKINSNNWRFAPPGGESQRAVEKRMLAWINQTIVSKYPQQANVAVFSHGMAIKCLFRGIMRSSPKQTYKINLDNTSITRLKYTKRGWHLITLNDTAHLLGQERMLDQYASG